MSDPVCIKQIASDKAFYGNLAEQQTHLKIPSSNGDDWIQFSELISLGGK